MRDKHHNNPQPQQLGTKSEEGKRPSEQTGFVERYEGYYIRSIDAMHGVSTACVYPLIGHDDDYFGSVSTLQSVLKCASGQLGESAP